jgi:hypothetical protein
VQNRAAQQQDHRIGQIAHETADQLQKTETHVAQWTGLVAAWLRLSGFLPAEA